MKKIRFLCFPALLLLAGFLFMNFVPVSLPVHYELKRSGVDFAVFHYNHAGNVDEYFKVQGCEWDFSDIKIKHVEYRPKTSLALVDTNGIRYVFVTTQENAPAAAEKVKVFNVTGFGHFEVKGGTGWSLEKMEQHAFEQ